MAWLPDNLAEVVVPVDQLDCLRTKLGFAPTLIAFPTAVDSQTLTHYLINSSCSDSRDLHDTLCGSVPFHRVTGSSDGTLVRVLASHQCGLGSTPGPGVMCGLILLLVLVLAPRGFSPGTPVFPSPQKPTSLNSNSILVVSPVSILC